MGVVPLAAFSVSTKTTAQHATLLSFIKTLTIAAILTALQDSSRTQSITPVILAYLIALHAIHQEIA